MPVAEVVESYTEYVVAWVTALQVTLIVIVLSGELQLAAGLAGAAGSVCAAASPLLALARWTSQLVAAHAGPEAQTVLSAAPTTRTTRSLPSRLLG